MIELRKARKARRLSQAQISGAVGISMNAISMLESKGHLPGDEDMCRQLASAYGLAYDCFLAAAVAIREAHMARCSAAVFGVID